MVDVWYSVPGVRMTSLYIFTFAGLGGGVLLMNFVVRHLEQLHATKMTSLDWTLAQQDTS